MTSVKVVEKSWRLLRDTSGEPGSSSIIEQALIPVYQRVEILKSCFRTQAADVAAFAVVPASRHEALHVVWGRQIPRRHPDQGLRRNAQQRERIRTGLKHPSRRLRKNEHHPVRLDGSEQMEGLALTGIQIRQRHLGIFRFNVHRHTHTRIFCDGRASPILRCRARSAEEFFK